MTKQTDPVLAEACGICVHNELIRFCGEKRSIGSFARRTIKKRIKGNITTGMTISRKRIIVIAAAAALIFALSACALVPAVRNAVKEIFTYVFSGGVLAETEEGLTTVERIMIPSSVPENFERTLTFSKGMTHAEYTDGSRRFNFSQLAADFTVLFRSDGTESVRVSVNGLTAEYFILSEKTSALMWTDGEYQYLLSGEFESLEELTAIAESVAAYEE